MSARWGTYAFSKTFILMICTFRFGCCFSFAKFGVSLNVKYRKLTAETVYLSNHPYLTVLIARKITPQAKLKDFKMREK